MEYEPLPAKIMMIDNTMWYLNLSISIATNAACLYIIFSMVWWLYRTRKVKNVLKRQFIVAVIVKGAIWYWTYTQIKMMLVLDMTLPNETLVPRVMFLIGVLIHVFVTIPYIRFPDSDASTQK